MILCSPDVPIPFSREYPTLSQDTVGHVVAPQPGLKKGGGCAVRLLLKRVPRREDRKQSLQKNIYARQRKNNTTKDAQETNRKVDFGFFLWSAFRGLR